MTTKTLNRLGIGDTGKMLKIKYLFLCICGNVTNGTFKECPRCHRSMEDNAENNPPEGGI